MSRRHQLIVCLVCFIVISISLLAAESQIPQVILDWQKAGQLYNWLLKWRPSHNEAVVWKQMQIQNALDIGHNELAKAEVENLFSIYQDKSNMCRHGTRMDYPMP
jgi:hypothetical protein